MLLFQVFRDFQLKILSVFIFIIDLEIVICHKYTYLVMTPGWRENLLGTGSLIR